jgi:Nuclease-related domain
VIDKKLRASLEKVHQRGAPLVRLEPALLVDPDPWQPLPSPEASGEARWCWLAWFPSLWCMVSLSRRHRRPSRCKNHFAPPIGNERARFTSAQDTLFTSLHLFRHLLASSQLLRTRLATRQRAGPDKRADALELGSRGEKVVADALEPLRAYGYVVFHDVQGDGFNIDHVLVGPGGVFVIETKARSKRGNATVTYRADEILVDGRRLDPDPLNQVMGLRRWLADLIKETCALTPRMRAVVLFPGWFIEGSSSGREVWVLTERVLPRFIEKEDPVLPEGDIARISSMLAARNRTHVDDE